MPEENVTVVEGAIAAINERARKGVPPAHGTNRWTAAMVRKAYVS